MSSTPSPAPSSTAGGLVSLWQRLRPRERWAVVAATALVVSATLWLLMVRPAWHTLATAATQHAAADAQLGTMQRMAAQAQAVRAIPKVTADEGLRALDLLVKAQLGAGSGLSATGDQATVTLKAVPAASLLTFIQGARVQARALPSQVSLQRSVSPGTTTAVLWDGRITLTMHSSP